MRKPTAQWGVRRVTLLVGLLCDRSGDRAGVLCLGVGEYPFVTREERVPVSPGRAGARDGREAQEWPERLNQRLQTTW